MKVLVKASEDPLRELLRNIKRESMGPQDARELLQYFGDMNTTFENREGERQLAGRTLADDFPNQPNISNRKYGGLERFRNIARENQALDLEDDADAKRIADIMSGEAFPELKDIKGELGQEYDAIRDNTDTHMQDIESEYEQYKKLMSIIGNPIMGMKDFAEAKGWIQPNEGLTFDDRQLLEQIRSGTPPKMHPSQIGDMSLQEFDRNVPVESYASSSKGGGNSKHFIDLLKLVQLENLRGNTPSDGPIQKQIQEFRGHMEGFESTWKQAHNKHPHKNNAISYIDYDDWSKANRILFRDPVSYQDVSNPNIHLEKAMETITPENILENTYQSKRLPQLQDFVSHPAVSKYIQETWNTIEKASDGKGVIGLNESLDEKEVQKHNDIFNMHVNNKTDALNIMSQHYETENPDTHGISMHQNIGPMPNYQYANQLNNSTEYHSPYYIYETGLELEEI